MKEIPHFAPHRWPIWYQLWAFWPSYNNTSAVFEIALGTLVDIRSTNVPTFGGPALILVDQRHMQYGDEKDLIMISQGNATWNTKNNSLY